MARRSLRPQLNQIRAWVREGRTDAWIAHKLEVTVQQIQAFKQDNDLAPAGAAGSGPGPDFDDEIDLRAEDDAPSPRSSRRPRRRAAEEEARRAEEEARAPPEGDESDEGDDDGEEAPPAAAGAAAGAAAAAPARGPLEGTFDHGDEGYGLWLDPAVADDPTYAEHWAGHRPVTVTIEEDQIVIRRAGDDDDDDD